MTAIRARTKAAARMGYAALPAGPSLGAFLFAGQVQGSVCVRGAPVQAAAGARYTIRGLELVHLNGPRQLGGRRPVCHRFDGRTPSPRGGCCGGGRLMPASAPVS